MRPLQHKCPTLHGNKEKKERQETITCQKFHPNTRYRFQLMYACITRGCTDKGPLHLISRPRTLSPKE